jgi:hypothetical protein
MASRLPNSKKSAGTKTAPFPWEWMAESIFASIESFVFM